MNPALRKILTSPHVATSFSAFAVVLLVNIFNVPAEKANLVVASAIGLMLAIDAVIAGTAESTVPGTSTSTVTTKTEVQVPAALVPTDPNPPPKVTP